MRSLPNELTLLLDNDGQVPMIFRRIPCGGFLMGARGVYENEEPAHWVEISEDFYLGQYPVTQQQFAVWTALAGEEHENEFPGNDQHPAEKMSWHKAAAYCQWLNERLALVIKKLPQAEQEPLQPEVKLPTEAQWEYACSAWQELDGQAGDPARRLYTEFHTGDGESALAEAGWFSRNSGGHTHPVAQKAANRHGLHDMHGNVCEWCRDACGLAAYCWRSQGLADPAQENDDSCFFVLRGGAYLFSAEGCSAAVRNWDPPDYGVRFYGFRAGLFPVRRSSE